MKTKRMKTKIQTAAEFARSTWREAFPKPVAKTGTPSPKSKTKRRGVAARRAWLRSLVAVQSVPPAGSGPDSRAGGLK